MDDPCPCLIDEVANLLWFYKPQALQPCPSLAPNQSQDPLLDPSPLCSACSNQQRVKHPRSPPIVHLSAIPHYCKNPDLDGVNQSASVEDRMGLSKAEEEDNDEPSNSNHSYKTRLSQVFDTVDENKDGKVSKDELKRFLDTLGLQSTYESILSLFKSIRIPSSKDQEFVTSNDFLLLYEITSCDVVSSPQQLQPYKSRAVDDLDPCLAYENDLLFEVFNIFDKDNDGFISPCELQVVLCGLGFNKALELNACIEMISRFDQDGDGHISFLEFKDMLEFTL